MTAFERITEALQHGGFRVTGSGVTRVAQCPAHDDNSPSLSLRSIDGQTLVFCHAGCDTNAVMTALNMTMTDLFDDHNGVTYRYTNSAGSLLRTVSRTPDKRFRQHVVDKSTVTLYRLPQVETAVSNDETIYLVEGEKDVHALEAVGVVATTGPQGASNIGKVDLTPLHGANVVAIVDRDQAGKKWAATILERLDGAAQSLDFRQAKVGKDAADHVAAGLSLDDLQAVEVVGAPARRAHITWANTIEPRPVVWAWKDGPDGRIPAGSLTVSAGREGTGKSSFGIWQTANITKGTLPGSFEGTPRRVLYVAVEDSWEHTLVPRLMAAEADLSLVGRFEVLSDDDDELTLSLPHDNALLEQAIREHDIALVVIDPLMSVLGDSINASRSKEVRTALDPLARIATRTGAVIHGIAHFNKGNASDPTLSISESKAFTDVPRSVFTFARDDDNECRVMTQTKNSLGRDWTSLPSMKYGIVSTVIATKYGDSPVGRFTFQGASDRTVADIHRDNISGADTGGDRREAVAWLEAYLKSKGGSCNARDAITEAAAVGIAKTTLTRARRSAKVKTVKGGMSGGWTWTLEESTEETEGTTVLDTDSSVPSVDSSQPDIGDSSTIDSIVDDLDLAEPNNIDRPQQITEFTNHGVALREKYAKNAAQQITEFTNHGVVNRPESEVSKP